MKTFDCKQTSWEGLWYHPETLGYTSAAINLSKLKQFKGAVRIYVRKNKYYNGGENGRPNYVFCIKDAKSETFVDADICDDNRCGTWVWCEELVGMTILEGWKCSKCDYPNGYKRTKFCPGCGAKMMNAD